VLPIFMGKCYRCHDNQAKFLHHWLDYNEAFDDRAEIKRRIWDSWKGLYFKQPMPTVNSPEYEGITEEERALIKDWVESGAAYGVLSAQSNHKSKPERIELGKRLFTTICSACHQPTGQGIPNRFPPLAGSDFLNADKNRAIKVLIHGLQGEVTVNGRKFNNSMPSFPLGDEDIANALTYVYNSFGNSGKEVTPEEVGVLRAQRDDIKASANQTAGVSRPDEKSPWE
jgi:mono/diheme cytochrome c family protein